MNTKIYYFSGTGNSYFITNKLIGLLPDSEAISIVKALSEKNFDIPGKTVGFVFPCHGTTIPIPLKIFLDNIHVENTEYFFAVAIRGGSVFSGFDTIKKLLSRHKKILNASFIINMACNDPKLKAFTDLSKTEMNDIEKNAVKKAEFISRIVRNKEAFQDDLSGVTFSKNRLLNSILGKLLPVMTHYFSPKVKNYFYSDSKCSGCGTCEKVCLSKKIKMVNHRPFWQKRVTCYLCYACLNYCPQNAIQIHSKIWMKSYTPERGRYPHPYADYKQISKQKDD